MNLTTKYLGLELKNPIVVSSLPLSRDPDAVKRLEDAGAAGLVMHSLFEEQIGRSGDKLDHYLAYGHDDYGESLTYFPDINNLSSAEEHLELMGKIKQNSQMPIIGSLNGTTPRIMAEYAAKMQATGIDALELNLYELPTELDLRSADVETLYAQAVKAVCEAVDIPVAVKLPSYITALPNFCHRLVKQGASGLVLFNRFYQPDIDINKLSVEPHLTLSTSQSLRLPLRWTAILYNRVKADLALTSGVHTYEDAVKSLLAGASVAMMASCILRNGAGEITKILDGLTGWMEEHKFESVDQFRGRLSREKCPDPVAFERANYLRVLGSYEKK